jgi:acetyl esterase/lipase
VNDARNIAKRAPALRWGWMIVFAVLCWAGSFSGGLARPAPALAPTYADLAYGSAARQKLDLYLPPKPAPGQPLVIFFYSGDWQYGSKKDYSFVAAELVKHGYAVAIPDYRLYPDVKFPAFIEDGAAAIAWVKQHDAEYHVDARNLFLMGDSSGAYLAVMLALDSHYLGQVDVQRRDLAGVIGIAGPYDFLNDRHFDTRPVLRDASNPASTQPINFADGTGPPLLLLAGEDDDVISPANSTALAAKQAKNGGNAQSILYPKIGHIGIMLPFSPLYYGSDAVVQDVLAFLAAHTKQ